MYEMKIDKADGVQHHDLSSKVSDIIEEMCTCHQKFEPDDDTEEYTFTRQQRAQCDVTRRVQ